MLPKKNRLPSSVRLSHPLTIQAPCFTLRFLKTEEAESRLAIVVSKKVDKSAVARNRIRRLISQFMQEHWSAISQSVDMIIFVQKPFSNLSSKEKEELFASFLSKGVFSEKTSGR